MTLAVVLAVFLASVIQAPEGRSTAIVHVPQAEVLKRLVKRVEPIHPPLAQVARFSGTIQFDVLISAQGTVERIKVFSGMALLNDAAVMALRKWTFAPFTVNGQPVAVRTIIEVPVGGSAAPRPSAQAREFADESLKCQLALDEQLASEALALCPRSLQIAESMGKSAFNERAIASRLNGAALMLANRPAEALPLFESALDAMRKAGLMSPNERLALVYFGIGQTARATGEAKRGEEYLRRAEKEMAGLQTRAESQPDLRKSYVDILTEFVAALKDVGNVKDAEKMQARLDDVLREKRYP